MSYRKFKLVNSLNNEWKLTDLSVKSFLGTPQGLGFAQTLETNRYGLQLDVKSNTFGFPVVGGSVLFYDTVNANKYSLYAQFVDFISYSPLTLKYLKPGTNDYFSLDVEVTQLQKGEVGQDGILTCPITLQGLSFWKGAEVTQTGTTITISNQGQFPVGFEIQIDGALSDPYFTLDQDGVYGEAKFNGSFDSVYVNSKDGEQSVELVQNSAILPNPLSYQDLSISNGAIYVTFVKLARGSSTLEVNGGATSVTVKYIPLYRSV